jgi:hypothetical protein
MISVTEMSRGWRALGDGTDVEGPRPSISETPCAL